MASIQLPYGGASINVDIPDFALETTQQDIARESSESNSILAQIASHMGVEVRLSRDQGKATDQLISKIDQQTNETKSLGRQLKGATQGMIGRGSMGMQNALGGISGKESVADLMGKNGLLGAVPGMGNAGAMIGSLFGILEEFGNSMGTLRRVGAGVGIDLQQLRSDAAKTGIGLETLGKIVTNNGATIRSLGANTVEGTRNFVELNKVLQEQTKSLGYFGMAADQLAAILTDEIELRRRASGLNANENIDRIALARSIKENLRLQEAMAAATGTDLADRVKAQVEMRRDAQIAMAMRNMSEQQIDAFEIASGDTTLFGSGTAGQAMITDILKNQLAGGNIGQVDGAAQLSGLLSDQGVDLIGTMQKVNAAIQAGDTTQVQDLMRGLANSVKEIDSEELNRLALSNDSAALAIQMAADSIGYTADALVQAQRVLESEQGRKDMDLTSTRLTMNAAAEQFRTTLMESILNAFKIPSITDSNFSKFVDSLADFPSNKGFISFLNTATQFNANASGAAGIVFTMSDMGEASAEQKSLAQANMFNSLLEGLGIDTGLIGKSLKMAAAAEAGMDNEFIGNVLTPSIDRLAGNIADLASALGYDGITNHINNRKLNDASDRMLIEIARQQAAANNPNSNN